MAFYKAFSFKRLGALCLALLALPGCAMSLPGDASGSKPAEPAPAAGSGAAPRAQTPEPNSETAALPSLLASETGEPVTTAAQWETERRPQVLKLLETYEYGTLPPAARQAQPQLELEAAEWLPAQELWLQKGRVHCTVNGGEAAFAVLVYTARQPGGAGEEPLPVVLALSAFGSLFWSPDLSKGEAFFPAKQLADAGFMAVCARVDDVCAPGWQELFFPEGERSCGEIALWAWAASLARQSLAALPGADPERIHVTGCSRAGKAALWAAAQDEAFASVAANVSGCSGAAITRGKTGERVADITGQFPTWFCPAYSEFAGREEAMPFDQHFLLGLLAPRPAYIASASLDAWSDPQAEFAACVAASPVWELYGLAGVGGAELPGPDSPLQTGALWYHQRQGEHGLAPYDWQQYLLFWNSCF